MTFHQGHFIPRPLNRLQVDCSNSIQFVVEACLQLGAWIVTFSTPTRAGAVSSLVAWTERRGDKRQSSPCGNQFNSLVMRRSCLIYDFTKSVLICTAASWDRCSRCPECFLQWRGTAFSSAFSAKWVRDKVLSSLRWRPVLSRVTTTTTITKITNVTAFWHVVFCSWLCSHHGIIVWPEGSGWHDVHWNPVCLHPCCHMHSHIKVIVVFFRFLSFAVKYFCIGGMRIVLITCMHEFQWISPDRFSASHMSSSGTDTKWTSMLTTKNRSPSVDSSFLVHNAQHGHQKVCPFWQFV